MFFIMALILKRNIFSQIILVRLISVVLMLIVGAQAEKLLLMHMARWIALKLLKKYGAREVLVYLGYVIGKAEPIIKAALIDGKQHAFNYDCRPRAIIEKFDLRSPIFHATTKNGHTGQIGINKWEII